MYLWIEDEHGVIIDPGGYIDLGYVSASRRKKSKEPRQEGQSKRQRTEECNANADRPPHVHAQLLGLASDQNPSNLEPGPAELTGSTTTSPAPGTPPNACYDWNPTIFSISSVYNSIDDNNYYHNNHNNYDNNNNSYAAPLRADSVATLYPQPSVVQPNPLALPASAPPQGETAREDESGAFDTNQFLN